MADLRTALLNLSVQEPLRHEDGYWNLAIVLDQRGLSAEGQECFQRIRAVARQVGVPCQWDWSPPPSEAHVICIVAHNHVAFRRDLLHWGQEGWLRGRYLILFVCGHSGESALTPKNLTDELGVVGALTFAHQIQPTAVACVLEQLLTETGPT